MAIITRNKKKKSDETKITLQILRDIAASYACFQMHAEVSRLEIENQVKQDQDRLDIIKQSYLNNVASLTPFSFNSEEMAVVLKRLWLSELLLKEVLKDAEIVKQLINKI